MKRFLLIGTIILPIVILVACGNTIPVQTAGPQQVQVNGGSYWDITPAQLNLMLEHKDFLLVNVHIPYEGEISQTDLFVPYSLLILALIMIIIGFFLAYFISAAYVKIRRGYILNPFSLV